MFKNYPTAFDYVSCSVPTCASNKKTRTPVTFFTHTTNNRELNDLQDYINSRTDTDNSKCNEVNSTGEQCQGFKTKSTTMSKLHLFIDILNWEGICLYY